MHFLSTESELVLIRELWHISLNLVQDANGIMGWLHEGTRVTESVILLHILMSRIMNAYAIDNNFL